MLPFINSKISMLFAAMLVSLGSYAQEVEIKGHILGQDKQPVGGVNIIIKGTPDGTVSNADGDFALSAQPGEVTFIIAFDGYKSLEKQVHLEQGKSYSLDVEMVKDTKKNRKIESTGTLKESGPLQ